MQEMRFYTLQQKNQLNAAAAEMLAHVAKRVQI
jgi:hypothetical protein